MADASSRNPRGPEPAGVSRVLAVVLSTVGFFALAVFGLGAVSLATDTDIIAVEGLGPFPGVGGMLIAVVAFALLLRAALGRPHPSFVSTIVIAISTALAHLFAVWVGVLLAQGGFLLATVVAGDLVRGGASAVIALAAGIGAWAGIALRRTRTPRPRWPWEGDDAE